MFTFHGVSLLLTSLIAAAPARPPTTQLPITQANHTAWLRCSPLESGRVFATLLADLKPSAGPGPRIIPRGSLLCGSPGARGTVTFDLILTNDERLPLTPITLRFTDAPPAPPAAQAKALEPPGPQAHPGIWIQLLAIDQPELAARTAASLQKALGGNLVLQEGHRDDAGATPVYRIRRGPFPDLPAARQACESLKPAARRLGLHPFITR